MSETSELSLQGCEDCIEPAEAFAVVANETRLAILEELWKADDRPVPFSELRRRVGLRDSAQFNYHLGKLTDHFVKKTDDGYDFRYAGKKVVRAVASGSFNEHPEVEPFQVAGDCVSCGGDLYASYRDEQLSVECRTCKYLHGRYSFPPGGLHDRTNEEVADAFNQRVRHLHCLAADGVCPECTGRMTTTLSRGEVPRSELDVCVEHRCEKCRHTLHSAVGVKLLDQSDVVTFYRRHGIDLGTTPYWQLPWCVSDQHTEVLSEDPWKVRVSIPLEDEVLRVTLDESLQVLDVEGPEKHD